MLGRGLVYLRRLSTVGLIFFLITGISSCFSSTNFGYRWRSGVNHQEVSTIGIRSQRGVLIFYSSVVSSTYFDACARYYAIQSVPSSINYRIGWFFLSPPVPRFETGFGWGIRVWNVTRERPLPTFAATRPTTLPVVTYPTHAHSIWLPYWLLLLITVPLPIYELIDLPTRRRKTRLAAGLCVQCGYDLRHSPDRCPECGSVPGTAVSSSLLSAMRLPMRRGLWLRLWLYPIFFLIFLVVFSWAYELFGLR